MNRRPRPDCEAPCYEAGTLQAERLIGDPGEGVNHQAKQQALEPLDVWLKTQDRGLPTLEPNPWAGDE